MAEKRMFAKTIIDSDLFLDMPLSAQALYFHLAMRADDDGFVNNPNKIMRMVSADKDSMRLLEAKRFIIPFESGVIVIRHWRVHNYIQNDRYKPTLCQCEKSLLQQDEKGVYNLDTECLQDVHEMDTQIRLDQNRLDQNRLDQNVCPQNASKADEADICPYQKIIELYHGICVSYPHIRGIDGERKKSVKARWTANPSLETFKELFTKAEASSFLKGNNDRKWHADFDFMMKPSKFTLLLEGKYDDRKQPEQDDGIDHSMDFMFGDAPIPEQYQYKGDKK